jgi:hypothetical protein
MGLTSTSESYEQLSAALYGDGAWELVKKRSMTEERQRRERTQARVGLASNMLGIGAGVAGTAAALRDDRFATGGKVARKLYATGQRIPKPISSRGGKAGALLAGGALGLQVANVAGDAVANRVLARSAKKPKKLTPVHKGLLKKKDEEQPKAKLLRIGAAAGTAAAVQAKQELKKNDELEFTISGEISKSNDKRQVFGWASVVEINGEPVVDLQGDYMAIEVIEKAAYDYVHSSRRGGDMHGADSHVSDLIESFVITPDKKEQLGLPSDTPTGWWVGFQVHDDDIWQMVKDGKRPEFSIHGSGTRVDVEI